MVTISLESSQISSKRGFVYLILFLYSCVLSGEKLHSQRSRAGPSAECDLRHASTMTTDLSYTALQMRYNTGVLITLSLIGVVLAHELPRHLARQIESVQPKRQKESVSTTSLCDPTLSFTEIYYTIPSHPELGGTMFVYQQIDCSTYNRSLYYLQNEQPLYASSVLTAVALPETSGSYAGTEWRESIRMELTIDPLDWTRERWFWSADGSSLIHETTYDHLSLRRSANSTTELYTWHSESEIWSSLSSTLVLKRLAGFTRSYQVPAPAGVAPQDALKLDTRFDTLKLNKTGIIPFEF